MPTFQNRQLVPGNDISADFEKLNLNNDEVAVDLQTQSDQLVQIIEETDLDPNKDPEVTNARDSAPFNTIYATVKERLDAAEEIISGKNLLINGNFDIWQDGLTILGNVASQYAADMTFFDLATANYTISRQDGTGVSGSEYALRYARNSGAGDLNNRVIRQGIETKNAIKLRGKFLTLSFWARAGADHSAVSNLLNVLLQTGTGVDEPPNAYTGVVSVLSSSVALTTSWQKFTFTIPVAILNSVNEINYTIFDTPTGTAGANDWYEATQIKLEEGKIATKSIPMLINEVLEECQRYYEKTFDQSIAPANGTGSTNGVLSSTAIAASLQPLVTWQFKVKKRIVPTVTLYNPRVSGTVGQWSDNSSDGANARSFFTGEGSVIIDNTTVALTTAPWFVHAVADARL